MDSSNPITKFNVFAISLILLFILLAITPPCNGDNRQDRLAMKERYEQWMKKYNRIYKDEVEKERRFNIYWYNILRIKLINARNYSYTLTDNMFADLTDSEFTERYLGYKTKLYDPMVINYNLTTDMAPIPTSIDWRTKGAVTPIKNQGGCGACWAFSAVAAVEGFHQIKTGKLLSLSEQELLDCDKEGENDGCNGGFMNLAFDFIKQRGLTTDENYPYIGKSDNSCNTLKASKKAATITGHVKVPPNDEEALARAVAKQPVSVAIDAGGFPFQFYSHGVFNGPCSTKLNHGVTAVGYGVDELERKYWIVKNSWGNEWGEGGYIRMRREGTIIEGICGIAKLASYPS